LVESIGNGSCCVEREACKQASVPDPPPQWWLGDLDRNQRCHLLPISSVSDAKMAPLGIWPDQAQ
jgi:hypothetical protein